MSASYARSKYKYVTLINVTALFLVLVALSVVSVASLLQTVFAFGEMSDPDLVLDLGFVSLPIGMTLPWMFGFIFQYGQNVALYIRVYYCNDVPMSAFYLMDKKVVITSRKIATTVFFVFAAVDSLTNVLWFYKNVESTGDTLVDTIVMVVGYPAMVFAVFVEEGLGLVAQALRRAWLELRQILLQERSIRTGQSYRPAPDPEAPAPPSQPSRRQPYRPPSTDLNEILRPASTLRRPTSQPPRRAYDPPEPTYHPVSYDPPED